MLQSVMQSSIRQMLLELTQSKDELTVEEEQAELRQHTHLFLFLLFNSTQTE